MKETEGKDNSEVSSSKIHVKVELVHPEEVAADETELSKTLLEVTLKTCEGEVNLDEIQILSKSVNFSKGAGALKATGTQSHIKKK